MSAYYSDSDVTLWHGDCLDVLRSDTLGYPYLLGYNPPFFPDASVDSVVTDPPYGIGFMGKVWDHQAIREAVERDHATRKSRGPDSDSRPGRAAPRSSSAFGDAAIIAGPVTGGLPFQQWCEAWARECLRVLKPGGFMLAFGGTRTSHRLAVAVEDAGFEMRDSIAWLYGSGFPKSLDVSKAIDKAAGAEREVVGLHPTPATPRVGTFNASFGEATITAPATPDARTWQGWGTALKPAFEPIVVGRKPLIGTVAANVLAHGTGALNIDGCRVATHDGQPAYSYPNGAGGHSFKWNETANQHGAKEGADLGRWPANVVLDGSQADALDAQAGTNHTGGQPAMRSGIGYGSNAQGTTGERINMGTGGASRYFPTFRYEAKAPALERPRHGEIAHPTVKPLDLMRWLVRLVTPPGGTVLEPFAGSGTTAEACILEGFKCIAIEREADYLPLIVQRISKPLQVGLGLDFGGAS